MHWVAGNGLTLEELERLEEAAHHSQTVEAKSVLRLAAALREALQLKECALYTQSKDNPERIRKSSPCGREQ
jgi:transcription elongation GreA/GreB family factor